MTPYYEQDGQTIFHADCRDVLDEWDGLRAQSFDLLLTDPPYGIGVAPAGVVSASRLTKGTSFGAYPSTNFGAVTWDGNTCADMVAAFVSVCRRAIVFGGNYYDLPPARGWLVWDKDNAGTNFADAELAWTNLDQAVRLLRFSLERDVTGRRRPERNARTSDDETGTGYPLGDAASAGRADDPRSVYGQRDDARRR